MKTLALPTDGPALRLYIISLFALLQGLKCYDFITIRAVANPGLMWFLTKWFFLDTCFIYVLPYLNIPWLKFRRSSQLLQIAFVLLLNWGLSFGWEVFRDSGLTFGLIWRGIWRRSAVRKKKFDLSVLQQGTGRHGNLCRRGEIATQQLAYPREKSSPNTPRKVYCPFLPAHSSTAKINPAGKPFCLRHKQTTPLTVPIRLNGTTPILIQYSHTTFSDPPVVHHHDIVAKPLKSMIEHAESPEAPDEEGIQILPFHVAEIGAYKLERVVDKSGNDVRIYRSAAIVVECPTAEISSFNENEAHFCQGETDALKIHVRGVPPLHLTYTQTVNGHPINIPIDSIQPESFTSPLLHGESTQHVVKQADYSFAQAHPVTLTYPLSLDTVGIWTYVLTEVRDALGNRVEYESPPGYSITVHERPKVSLRGCSEDNPIKLLKGRDTSLYFNVQTTEPGPFEITLGYIEPDSSSPSKLENHTLTHKRDSLSITQPGVYTLQSIATRYCPGDVLAPQSCLVITPPEPTLQIEWSTLKDHCSGTVGVTADLTFIGEPPFHLSYRVLSKSTNQQEVKRIKVDRTRHQMDFKPEVAGTYQYDFIALDDANYRYIELEGGMFSHEATIHPLPGVKFVDLEPQKTCIGSSLNVPIRMIGSGPWNLTYDIVESGGRRQSYSIMVDKSETTLELPEFRKGGRGTVSLRSVTDGGGCKVQLGEQDLVVDVRREKPSARFYGNNLIGREGDAIKIPLRLTGEGPWYLKYVNENLKGERFEHEAFVTDPNGVIDTRSDGTFELASVRDSSCPGIIKQAHQKFEISWIARPKVEIIGFKGTLPHEVKKLDDVCCGQDAFLDLGLHGMKS